MPTCRHESRLGVVGLVFFAVGSLIVGSCSGSGDDNKKEPGNKPVIENKDATAPPRGVPSVVDAGLTSLPPLPREFVTVGVAGCDTYITAQRKCIEDSAPEQIRKPQLAGLRAIAAKWAQAANAGRTGQLEKTCAQMRAASAAATKAWGCRW